LAASGKTNSQLRFVVSVGSGKQRESPELTSKEAVVGERSFPRHTRHEMEKPHSIQLVINVQMTPLNPSSSSCADPPDPVCKCP